MRTKETGEMEQAIQNKAVHSQSKGVKRVCLVMKSLSGLKISILVVSRSDSYNKYLR
jgi:hypothetical protein